MKEPSDTLRKEVVDLINKGNFKEAKKILTREIIEISIVVAMWIGLVVGIFFATLPINFVLILMAVFLFFGQTIWAIADLIWGVRGILFIKRQITNKKM